MNYLGLAPKKAESLSREQPQERPNLVPNGSSDEAKRLAAAALSAVKEAAAAAASVRGKVEVSTFHSKGEEPAFTFSICCTCFSA